ncbi:MAG TPA: hypothetical protein VNU19_13370 [Candidatus Acidoferrum sp.]|nr:hypothetical protein [Candidatus Acidoferrum sp.]
MATLAVGVGVAAAVGVAVGVGALVAGATVGVGVPLVVDALQPASSDTTGIAESNTIDRFMEFFSLLLQLRLATNVAART